MTRRDLFNLYARRVASGLGEIEHHRLLLGEDPGVRPIRARVAEGDDLIIIVADTGLGIPRDDRERIFKPFEKGDKTGAGVGLGLSLVRNFIQLHGGSIDVKSPPGRGTTITCRLPAKGDAGDLESVEET